ncbi:hypothetical protein CVT26_011820, partial [Gymnopilus dilepis]
MRFTGAVLDCERLAGYVRCFVFNPELEFGVGAGVGGQGVGGQGGYVPGTTRGHGVGEENSQPDLSEEEANTMGGVAGRNLGREFWGIVQIALGSICWNVEVLVLADPSALNSWVLDVPTQGRWVGARPPSSSPLGMALAAAAANATSNSNSNSNPPQTQLTPPPFYSFPSLHTLKLHFSFDTHAAAFLARLSALPPPFSSNLHTLHFHDTSEILSEHPRAYPTWQPGRLRLRRGEGLRGLRVFEGSVGVLKEVVKMGSDEDASDEDSLAQSTSPKSTLTHIQLPLSSPSTAFTSIETDIDYTLSTLSSIFPSLAPSLLSLSILDIPLNDPEWVQILLKEVGRTLHNLRHLGVVPWVEEWGCERGEPRGSELGVDGRGGKEDSTSTKKPKQGGTQTQTQTQTETETEAKGERSILIRSLMP